MTECGEALGPKLSAQAAGPCGAVPWEPGWGVCEGFLGDTCGGLEGQWEQDTRLWEDEPLAGVLAPVPRPGGWAPGGLL